MKCYTKKQTAGTLHTTGEPMAHANRELVYTCAPMNIRRG